VKITIVDEVSKELLDTHFGKITLRSMTARAIGSGTISFGLVSIPFKVYTAASSQNLSFNLLHKECSGRMKQQYRCPVEDKIVERTDMVKGFEFAKDQINSHDPIAHREGE